MIRRRVHGRVFTELALCILSLGLAVAAGFPFALLALGIPARLVLTLPFLAACAGAGLVLAAANLLLARRVVGSRLGALSGQMRYVADVIRTATFAGDWSTCSPDHCSLPVESDDALAEAAAAFNELIAALAGSRAVQEALRDVARTMSEHLDLEEFATAALGACLRHAGADGGALCVLEGDRLETVARHRLSGPLPDGALIRQALAGRRTQLVQLPDGMRADASLRSFRPAAVLVLPLTFRNTPLGALVAAFAVAPSLDGERLFDAFADPMSVALNNVLAHRRFQDQARRDPLTGCCNRRYGMGRLAEECSLAERSGSAVGILVFDLDHFKLINDRFGHPAGDRVLTDSVAAVQAVLRQGDVLVRMGGEEFLVLLPGTSASQVTLMAERIRAAVAKVGTGDDDGRVTVTVSLGGAVSSRPARINTEALLAAADRALYASKRAGRNCYTMVNDPSGCRPAPTAPAPREAPAPSATGG